MELLKQRILRDGTALDTQVLLVDSFLNHQVDVELMEKAGQDFARRFKDAGITRVYTIESSGIAPAMMTARYLGVPLVVMKKQASRITREDVFKTTVHSFTKATDYILTVSSKYAGPEDHALFIDDFLAHGEAAMGAANLLAQAGAQLVGLGIVIEKAFQPGRERLAALRCPIYSLARISKMDRGIIEFCEDCPAP